MPHPDWNRCIGYAIGGVLSQSASRTRPDKVVTKTDLSQWHLVAFISRKMILAETWYKIHDSKFCVIVDVFKTWRHYLESCKHKVLIFTDYNNLCYFIDIKNLSSKQVYRAQELYHYHFCINYWQSKTNWVANALSQYLQQNTNKKAILWAKNTIILYWLQSSLANVSDFFLDILSLLHKILVCGTTVLL